jgi:hypothetical protein
LQETEVYLWACDVTNAQQYRAQAANRRMLAAKSELANRRLMHERSAMTWDEMAQSAEDIIERSLINAAAKSSVGHSPVGLRCDETLSGSASDCAPTTPLRVRRTILIAAAFRCRPNAVIG